MSLCKTIGKICRLLACLFSFCVTDILVLNRALALRGHVTSFLWKWKLHDFTFETLLVGHLLNKIIVIWFLKPAPFAQNEKVHSKSRDQNLIFKITNYCWNQFRTDLNTSKLDYFGSNDGFSALILTGMLINIVTTIVTVAIHRSLQLPHIPITAFSPSDRSIFSLNLSRIQSQEPQWQIVITSTD